MEYDMHGVKTYYGIAECNTFIWHYYFFLLKHIIKLIFLTIFSIFKRFFNFSVFVRVSNTKRCSSCPMCYIQHFGDYSTYIYIEKPPVFCHHPPPSCR